MKTKLLHLARTWWHQEEVAKKTFVKVDLINLNIASASIKY